MKVAILTFHHAFNYGAELQCFALQYKLNALGYKAEVIYNFRPMNDEYQFIEDTKFKAYFNQNKKLSLRTRVNRVCAGILVKISNIIFKERVTYRKQKFYGFHDQFTKLSSDKFYNFDMLYNYNWISYSHFIVGSDQVWNYLTTYSNEPYFLTFAPKDAKKISYAASLGHSKIPAEISHKYKLWLDSFDFISVREKDGKKIIESLTNKPVAHVLDPTLLLNKDEWISSLNIKKFENDKYILIYVLIHSPYAIKLAQQISKEQNLSIKLISHTNWSVYSFKKNIEVVYDCGPREFVELFYNASFIITNSFHGTAFAINMNKPFFSCPRSNSMVISRFTSLLGTLGLSNRLVPDGSPFPKNINEPIEYENVNKILMKERFNSVEFLKESLKE